MEKDSRIYIAGHLGLVGSALTRCLKRKGFSNFITRPHKELELKNQAAVRDFFAREKPDYVFLAAARVGGIYANNTYPAEFIHQNIIVQDNVIHQSWKSGVKRLLFLGSSCIYPRDCPQPIKEEYLMSGPLEPTNRPYAVAKIAGIETCWAYNREYNTRFLTVMPTNLYGPGDTYNLESSHVLPALIRKMHEAKERGDEKVTAWGTGSPRREFLYSDDMAEACVHLLSLPDETLEGFLASGKAPIVNIGCGKDVTIKELVYLVKEIIGFPGKIAWDSGKPDGTPQKLLDVARFASLGWCPQTELSAGIKKAYADFLTHRQA